MAGLQLLNDRQMKNVEALPHIGSPANDTLDDIFSRIDAVLAGLTGGNAPYIAQELALTSGMGTTSVTVTIPAQSDTSYVVYALMENLVDPLPQFQQPLIQNKTTTGFNVVFNVPLSSNNYVLSYVIPLKAFPEGEFAIGSGASSASIPVLQGSVYGVISALENYGDANPQFQTNVVTAQSPTSFTSTWNVPTDTAAYVDSYTITASGSVAVGSGMTSVSVPLPINYNTAGYGVVATIVDVTDPNPQFQPILVTAKSDTSFVLSWNVPTDTANYSIYYYAISLTP